MDTTTVRYPLGDAPLPVETLGLIIENLRRDPASLSALSLVSSTFLAISRPHRFRDLTFLISPRRLHHAKASCLVFRELVTTTPELARFVRRLTLVLERWLPSVPNLLWIIQRFDRLSSLRLVGGVMERCINWEAFPLELQHALCTLLRRNETLHTLVISSYENVPWDLLRGATSLKHVSFNVNSWAPQPLDSADITSDVLARPASLSIFRSPMNQSTVNYLKPPRCLISLKALVILEVALTQEIGQQFEGIFGPCLRSLQELKVRFTLGAPIINLSRLPSLRVLKVLIEVSRHNTPLHGPNGFETLLGSLTSLFPASSRLELLDFRITENGSPSGLIRWRELDNVIARLHAAGPIQRVNIHCCGSLASTIDGGYLIRNQLPQLDALGLLVITASLFVPRDNADDST